MSEPVDIAIVGMACVYPGAPDLDAYWQNLRAGVDAITDAPPTRLDPRYFDASSTAPDRFYTNRGGFIDEYANFDPIRHGIMPVAARGADPDQLLTLDIATAALTDAGYAGPGARPLARERAAVIIGRGNYIGAGMVRLEQHVRTADQLVVALSALVPGLTSDELGKVKAEFQSRLGVYGPDTAIGLVPNLTASRIANRLDLRGPAYTVDGACASSLLALDQAVMGLQQGRLDLALVGGVHLSHDPSFWSVFCQLGALSRSGRIRPFAKDADGILIGEGVGVVVLKRTTDARRDRDRIYARIRGTGTASDGRVTSLMTPDVGGQERALAAAWEMAGLDRDSLGLIEAHGTGTPAGDSAELETLRTFFGPGPKAALGSVKSMIGHTMPAAGIAGLIKAALAVYHGVIPPTLHATTDPHPALAKTRFHLPDRSAAWEDKHRVAGINAFGFGGINAHVIIENEPGGDPVSWRPARRMPAPADEVMACYAAESLPELAAVVRAGGPSGGRGPCRVAIAQPTPERLEKAALAVDGGQPRRGRDGMFFEPKGLLRGDGKLAFVFPGVEAAFEPRIDDVAEWLGRAFRRPEEGSALERQGVGVIELGRLLDSALRRGGARPDVIAGHSIGEWSGMIASGILPEAGIDAFLETLAPNSLDVPGVLFLAAGAGLEKARQVAEGLDVVVSHDNCPHQVILCGPEAAIRELSGRMKTARVLAQILPFKSGFHAPYFAPYVGAHQAHLASLTVEAASIPLWSATTASPYPNDPMEIRTLSARHLVEPVRFREVIDGLYESGVRVFVQVGTGSLAAFVDDALRGKDVLAISANVRDRSGLAQLQRVLAALWVNGADVELPALHQARTSTSASRTLMHLELGVPHVRLSTALSLASAQAAALPEEPKGPVQASLAALLERVQAAGRAVSAADLGSATPRRETPSAPPRKIPTEVAPVVSAEERVTTIRLSVADYPYLIDHGMFPQPAGWASVSDRYPVVPMTMHVRLMMEAATALVPGMVAVTVEQVRARTWLAVEPAVDLTIRARRLPEPGPNGTIRVRVDLEGYSESVVHLAPTYPPSPPKSHGALVSPKAPPFGVRRLYDELWLFHGPAYQAVTALGPLGENGVDGTLAALPAAGALLDGAGQLFGFYIGQVETKNRLVLPIRIERIDWYGPEPAPTEPIACTVRVTKRGAQTVRGDLELNHGGRLLARVTGWEDWRFDTDERLWVLMREPHRVFYSDPAEPTSPAGPRVLDGGNWVKATHDYLLRRYLGEAERVAFATLTPGSRSISWLLGRIAAKDAIRAALTAEGDRARYPAEVTVLADALGRPIVGGHDITGLRVSIAHTMGGNLGTAIALASREPVGVDIEPIAPRTEAFVALTLSSEDLAHLPASLDADARAEWLTRFWCAKEAAGKASGKGLEGNPRALTITAIDGERIQVKSQWVTTQRRGPHILAWTESSTRA